jgi:spore germination protein KC
MKRAVRWAAVVLAAASLATLTGCQNYQEVENQDIVVGMAIDKGQQGYRYHMTFEIVDAAAGQSDQIKSKVLEADGNTISDAADNATKYADKNLFYSDCKIVIFSKDIAKEGLTQVLDWFNRDSKPRFTMHMYVSSEKTAGELLKLGQGSQQGGQQGGAQGGGQGGGQGDGQKGSQSGIISMQIADAMESVSTGGKSKQLLLYDVNNILLGEGQDLTLPCLQNSNQQIQPVEIKGTAVFNGDKYAGYLDDDATQNFLLFNKIKDSIYLVGENPSQRNIALEILRNEVTVNPEMKDGKISMKVKVKIECSFDEENTPQNFLLENGFKAVEEIANKTLKEDIGEIIKRVQRDFGCDIFGFGRRIYQENPKEWKKLKSTWHQKFRTVAVEIEPDVTIANAGFAKPKGTK